MNLPLDLAVCRRARRHTAGLRGASACARLAVLACVAGLLAACGAAQAATGPRQAPTHTAVATFAPEAGVVAAIFGDTATPSPALAPAVVARTDTPPDGAQAETPLLASTTTPTARSRVKPTLGYYNITPAPDATLATPIPTPVNPVDLDDEVVNILLIGTDYRAADPTFRTDTLIVVSTNKRVGSVSMLSIPRDLYVYIPKWGMSRINRAYSAAASNAYPGGGPALLQQTLLYNLGIPIHYYALVNFEGFRQIVDTLGGIDVAVNCQVTEYKLKDWTLDESDPANYDRYTQPIGAAHMDGDVALWYARARPVGGDFFRGYRQRQVLRAIYHAGLNADVIPQIPTLYTDFQAVVTTDMSLWDIMQFAPLATRLENTHIRSLHIGPNQVTGWITPRGEEVLLPKPEAIRTLVDEFLSDSTANQLARPVTWVEVWNATPNQEWERLAAETLANEGFAPLIGLAEANPYTTTTIIDFTTSPKGSPLKKLQSTLHVTDGHVIAQPDASSPAQFRVILGSDYNSCPRLDWMDQS